MIASFARAERLGSVMVEGLSEVELRRPSQKEGLRTDKSITTSAPKSAAEYEAAVDAPIAEMARMNERSERTWAEIERLTAESTAIQAEKQRLNASIDRRLEALAGLL